MTLTGMQSMLNAQAPPDKVRVFKDGDIVFIRSGFSSSQDVVIVMNKGSNGQINFSHTTLIPATTPENKMDSAPPLVIHQCGDDSTPWKINGTYLGANHGFSYGRNLEVKGYNFTNQDLGSIWLDGANNKFYVVKVLSPVNVWLLSENSSGSAIWKFNSSFTGDQLKNAVNGRACQIISNNQVQLHPFVRIKRVQYLCDGEKTLIDKELTLCNFLTIREESDIIDPISLLNVIKANPGKVVNFTDDEIASIISDNITYRLSPMGSCIIEYNSRANCDFILDYMGFIQSAPLNKNVFDSYTYYVPKSLPFEKNKIKYDFRKGQDFVPPIPAPLFFNANEKNIENSLNLPDRFIQIAGKKVNDEITSKVGYVIGYSPLSGVSKLGERAKNTENSLFVYTSSKSYPYAIDNKLGRIPAGKEFHCVAYRQYFAPDAYPNTNAVYYHQEGDAYIVYIDYKEKITRDTIKLPDHLIGKKISVLETSGYLSLPETVPAEGLILKIDEPYTYIVLKLD
jgi:hypothetical protein